jgi:outer membrane protein assembly factor BamA
MTSTQISVLIAALLITIVAVAKADDKPVDEAQLEADATVIGEVVLEKSDVFDLTDERENGWFYRWVNKLHIITRDEVIEKQLLLKAGDLYSKRLADESERILRRNVYLFDVSIAPVPKGDGTVDLHVSTRDVWTLKPSLSLSRKGGENKTTLGIHELNLLGRGQEVRIERTEDVDRTTNSFEFSDAQLGNSWVSASLLISDNSDGHSNFLSLIRPFYALDTRWTAGVTGFDDDRRSTLYDLGEPVAEYQHERDLFTAFGGWSAGLSDGWVRRYTTGIVFDDNQFSDVVDGTLQAEIPEDRNLVYPFLGFELLQDQFETTHNRDRIGRTEDFFTGTRFTATLGLSKEDFGSDRDAVLYRTSYSRGFGAFDKKSLLLSVWASGRQESGDSKNAEVGFVARYYRPQSEKRLFYMTMRGIQGHDLDLDNPIELGGDSGLRGYPLRYQSGDANFLFSVEQRFFWDWYPFRLFRVGGAVFFDVGRTWGDNPVGGESSGWLRDVGFGLRFAPTRTGARKILHLDIAFPLDGDASIDNVQILLEAKRSF